MMVRTKTNTYTRTRTKAVESQFRIFFRYSSISNERVEKMIEAVNAHELKAVGAYLTDADKRIYEVELQIDWDKHGLRVRESGDKFPNSVIGWSEGAAPEVEINIRMLAKEAERLGKQIRTWITKIMIGTRSFASASDTPGLHLRL